jgi:hypothetical protein
MKLYLVHCGFYDNEISDGIYENHTNLFIAADSFENARIQVKLLPVFQEKRMHIDGIQEIKAVNGYKIQLIEDLSLSNNTEIISFKHRDLAPKAASPLPS